MMDVQAAILTRRSVRGFSPEPVSARTLELLFKTAPSKAVNAINSDGGPAVAAKSGTGAAVLAETNSSSYAAVNAYNASTQYNWCPSFVLEVNHP